MRTKMAETPQTQIMVRTLRLVKILPERIKTVRLLQTTKIKIPMRVPPEIRLLTIKMDQVKQPRETPPQMNKTPTPPQIKKIPIPLKMGPGILQQIIRVAVKVTKIMQMVIRTMVVIIITKTRAQTIMEAMFQTTTIVMVDLAVETLRQEKTKEEVEATLMDPLKKRQRIQRPKES